MTVQSVKGPTRGSNGLTWDIKTDLDPQMLSVVALAMYRKWVDFAMGRASLGGKTLMHPTGRYANTIQWRRTGVASIAIMAVEHPMPGKKYSIAGIIEEGHQSVDLKRLFAQGKRFKLHRGEAGHYGSAGYGAPKQNPKGNMAQKKKVWASIRGQGFSGYARLGPTGWVIPEMPAYSPAAHLVDLLQQGSFHDV